jgi:hypothetical protein
MGLYFHPKIRKGDDYMSQNLYISPFSDSVLILRYINTIGGGEVVDGVPLRRLQAILVPG